jgi:hypothetical protein
MVLPLIIAGVAAAAGIGMQIIGGQKEKAAAEKQAGLSAKSAKKQNKKINEKIVPELKLQGKLEAKASKESAAAEALRAKQMELDATRTQREVVRNAILARATSVSAAANQGAMGSSGLFGSLSQITSQENRQLGGIFQNLSIGRGIFEHNANMAEFLTDSAKSKTKVNIQNAKLGTIANTSNAQIQAAGVNNGAMFTNIGSTLVSSAGTIAQLGTSAFGSKPT